MGLPHDLPRNAAAHPMVNGPRPPLRSASLHCGHDLRHTHGQLLRTSAVELGDCGG